MAHDGDDFVAHLRHAVKEMPRARRYHWVVDNNRTRSTPAVCALVAEMGGIELPAEGLETAKARRAWLSDRTHGHVRKSTLATWPADGARSGDEIAAASTPTRATDRRIKKIKFARR